VAAALLAAVITVLVAAAVLAGDVAVGALSMA
jgi:hypothetical protein